MTLYPHEQIIAWCNRHILLLWGFAFFLIIFIGWKIAWWMINPAQLQPYGCCELSDYQYP